MSIAVNNLTKTYGQQNAVDHITFEAKKGEILGFLGPNGAGKTTTMKILTCFIPQTSGTATVCGFDTSKDSMEVRKRIGYLPEHNPLYKDMYIKEYLLFIAGLHKLKNKTTAVNNMIERTGLGSEQHKLIGSLSKGYRQRVGLAQAMLHNPEVLILDEPISGLDPNQLVDIRNLIRDLGKEKTVIFSSHIMQEIQALCDRIIIIDRGKLVANNMIEDLKKNTRDEAVVTVEFNKAAKIEQLEKIKGVQKVIDCGAHSYQLHSDSTVDIRPEVFQFAVRAKLILLGMRQEIFTIEDVFQILTKAPKSADLSNSENLSK